jgi:hypothetical protein
MRNPVSRHISSAVKIPNIFRLLGGGVPALLANAARQQELKLILFQWITVETTGPNYKQSNITYMITFSQWKVYTKRCCFYAHFLWQINIPIEECRFLGSGAV